jgi:hypothetical protein
MFETVARAAAKIFSDFENAAVGDFFRMFAPPNFGLFGHKI